MHCTACEVEVRGRRRGHVAPFKVWHCEVCHDSRLRMSDDMPMKVCELCSEHRRLCERCGETLDGGGA